MSDALKASIGPQAVEQAQVREAVGVFDDQPSLQAAIDELMLSGFDRFELGLMDPTETAQGRPPEQLADDPSVKRVPYTAPESIGTAQGGMVAGFALLPAMGAAAATATAGAAIAATVAATAATGGVGALIGAAAAYAIGRKRSNDIAGQQDQGGMLLWVRARSAEHQQRALDILSRHAAHHVHAID